MAKHQFEILDFFETFLIQMNLTVEALNGEGPNWTANPRFFLALTFLPLDQLPKDSVQHFWFANTSFDTN